MSYYYATLLPQAFNSNNEKFFSLQIVNIKISDKMFWKSDITAFLSLIKIIFYFFCVFKFSNRQRLQDEC